MKPALQRQASHAVDNVNLVISRLQVIRNRRLDGKELRLGAPAPVFQLPAKNFARVQHLLPLAKLAKRHQLDPVLDQHVRLHMIDIQRLKRIHHQPLNAARDIRPRKHPDKGVAGEIIALLDHLTIAQNNPIIHIQAHLTVHAGCAIHSLQETDEQ